VLADLYLASGYDLVVFELVFTNAGNVALFGEAAVELMKTR
jgi:hypothetical protein